MSSLAEYIGVQLAVLRKQFPAEAKLRCDANVDIELYIDELAERAETSTKPAVLMSQFVTGKVPTSANLNDLAASAQDWYNYYADVLHVMRPKLGPYEALGRAFSDSAEFTAMNEGRDDTQFVLDAYLLAFRSEATPAHVIHFNKQIAYLAEMYAAASHFRSSAVTQSRGAVFGQIIGEAAIQRNSFVDDLAKRFLHRAAYGTAVYGDSIYQGSST